MNMPGHDPEYTVCPQCGDDCVCLECLDENGHCYECGYIEDDEDEA